jgi:hypothetical protein
MLDVTWAEHILTEGLPLFREDAHDSLSGFRLYLQTMEDFIDRKEKEEIASIKAKFPESAEINWSYHYPVYWEDIFFTQLRSSFIVSIVSFAEFNLNRVCKQVFNILTPPIKHTDKHKGGVIDRGKKYLKRFGKFNNPSDELWSIIKSIYLVRNCIVHNNNDIEDMEFKKQKQLGNLIGKLPGLSAAPAFVGEFGKYGFLKINYEFPIFSIRRIQDFVSSLYDELEQLCESLRSVNSWR